MTALALLSAATRPMLGPIELFDPGPMPAWLENLRSTGRFFWPVAYALLAGAVLQAARLPDRRHAGLLLAGIALFQFADTAELRHGLRDRIANRESVWLFPAEAMRAEMAHHESLTLLPSWGCDQSEDSTAEQQYQLQLLLMASETVLPATTMYVARWHHPPRCADEPLAAAPLGRGELRVLTPDAQDRLLAAIPRADELCRPIGPLVFCSDPAATDPPTTLAQGTLAPVQATLASRSPALALLGPGWRTPDAEGALAPDGRAELRGLRPDVWPIRARLDLATTAYAPQEVELLLGDRSLGRWTLAAGDAATRIDLTLPAGMAGPATLALRPMADAGAGLWLRRLCLLPLRYRAAMDACAG